MVKNTPLQIFATYNDEKFKILKRLKKKKKKKKKKYKTTYLKILEIFSD